MQCFNSISEPFSEKHEQKILISVKLSREYLVHLSWIKLASNPCGLDSPTGRAADRYPEGASSNPVRVNIFQLPSTVPDYHENFLFMFLV